ncbi:MAG: hypothetical protein Q8Q04_03645 [archaeon]|nr:hypothetical protein [archaeon]
MENIETSGNPSTKKIYNLGKLGKLETVKSETNGIINGSLPCKDGIYLLGGKDCKELEGNLLNDLKRDAIYYQKISEDYKEVISSLEEIGLEATSKKYNTFQPNKEALK